MSDKTEGSGSIQFEFWYIEEYGIIRQRRTQRELWPPERWLDGRWRWGGPYVVDAITGMGEEPWSCGELPADSWDKKQATEYADEHEINLFEIYPDGYTLTKE